jgi:hypothetical protein
MNAQHSIPHGEDKVTVELTVKEAMALGGYRFNQDSGLSAHARNQVRKALERTLLTEPGKVDYRDLDL